MSIIDDILGPLSPSNLFGDLGLPSMSDIIHDLGMLLMIMIGFTIVIKVGEHALENM
jgi:hypothetical protein